MQPGADGDLRHGLQGDGVELEHRPGARRVRRSVGGGLPGAHHVGVLAVGRHGRGVHHGPQALRNHVAGDDLHGLGIADHELIAGRGRIAVEQHRGRTGRAHVLVEIRLAGLGRELRLAGLPGCHDPRRILAPDAAFVGPSRPGLLHRGERLHRLHLQVPRRLRELTLLRLVRLHGRQRGSPPVHQANFQRQARQRADVHRDRLEIRVAGIHLRNDHTHHRVVLQLIEDVHRRGAEVQCGPHQACCGLAVAHPAADVGVEQLRSAVHQRLDRLLSRCRHADQQARGAKKTDEQS